MGGASRTTADCVIDELAKEPYRFSFVQAVRLLEQALKDSGKKPIGEDAQPSHEGLRIQSFPAHSFPPNEIAAIHNSSRSDNLLLSVAFMGLYGPSGVLPDHDTQRLIDEKPVRGKPDHESTEHWQERFGKFPKDDERQYPEREFLDLFNHRLLSLFFKASTKYSLPIAYERAFQEEQTGQDRSEVISRVLFALAGMGTGGLQHRLALRDELFVEFAGLFRTHTKNAASLEQIVSCYTEQETRVEQFVGQWLTLSKPNQSSMPTLEQPLGQNCRLGSNFILGERVWDVSGKFRVRIGPLDLDDFNALLPKQDRDAPVANGSETSRLLEIGQLIRHYVGLQFDFDIQLELLAEEVPEIELRPDDSAPQLGFNTWLFSEQPTDNKLDAVFVEPGFPLDTFSNSNA